MDTKLSHVIEKAELYPGLPSLPNLLPFKP